MCNLSVSSVSFEPTCITHAAGGRPGRQYRSSSVLGVWARTAQSVTYCGAESVVMRSFKTPVYR